MKEEIAEIGSMSMNEMRPTSLLSPLEFSSQLKLALVTPARNEVDFIEETIKSVIGQSTVPIRWVIVSDGSTDGTDEVVAKYAARFSWIELLRLPERKERHFAGKVYAFRAGYARFAEFEYDVIGNLDADITLPPGCIQYLLEQMVKNPRLGVVGVPFREGSYQYDYRFTSIEHVSGACQLFRRECFEQIGGYAPLKTGGVDLVAVIGARMKGWETRSFPEQTCVHNRKMGSAKHSSLAISLRGGWTDYTHGGDLAWQIFRSVYQLTRPPFVIGGTLLLVGYLLAMLTRTERVVSEELIQFRKIEQRRRLWTFLGRSIKRVNPGTPTLPTVRS